MSIIDDIITTLKTLVGEAHSPALIVPPAKRGQGGQVYYSTGDGCRSVSIQKEEQRLPVEEDFRVEHKFDGVASWASFDARDPIPRSVWVSAPHQAVALDEGHPGQGVCTIDMEASTELKLLVCAQKYLEGSHSMVMDHLEPLKPYMTKESRAALSVLSSLKGFRKEEYGSDTAGDVLITKNAGTRTQQYAAQVPDVLDLTIAPFAEYPRGAEENTLPVQFTVQVKRGSGEGGEPMLKLRWSNTDEFYFACRRLLLTKLVPVTHGPVYLGTPKVEIFEPDVYLPYGSSD